MGIPNLRKFRISSPDGTKSTVVLAVIPKGADVEAYLEDVKKRIKWDQIQTDSEKRRVGQQKQKKPRR